jgi:hypothetical protein
MFLLNPSNLHQLFILKSNVGVYEVVDGIMKTIVNLELRNQSIHTTYTRAIFMNINYVLAISFKAAKKE